jgi:hypothetical protein
LRSVDLSESSKSLVDSNEEVSIESLRLGEEPGLQAESAAAPSDAKKATSSFDERGDAVSSLEQDMAKLAFELAEARAQVDWYKLQHRQVHLEFEDLQAFCKQLQAENSELRKGIVKSRKKKPWFNSDRIRRLNQPKKRMDFGASMHDTSSFAGDQKCNSDEDWDDETLTTYFGGAGRMGEDSVRGTSRHGPLLTMSDQAKGSKPDQSRRKVIREIDDTPKNITVTNRTSLHEQTQTANSLHDTTEVESVESEDAPAGNPVWPERDPQRTKASRMRRNKEESTVYSDQRNSSSEQLSDHRTSIHGEHRFVPQRQGSGPDLTTSHQNVTGELDDLDFGSGHKQTEKTHETEEPHDEQAERVPEHEETKSWWAKMTPFQQSTPKPTETKSHEGHANQQAPLSRDDRPLVEGDYPGLDVDFVDRSLVRTNSSSSAGEMPTDLSDAPSMPWRK